MKVRKKIVSLLCSICLVFSSVAFFPSEKVLANGDQVATGSIIAQINQQRDQINRDTLNRANQAIADGINGINQQKGEILARITQDIERQKREILQKMEDDYQKNRASIHQQMENGLREMDEELAEIDQQLQESERVFDQMEAELEEEDQQLDEQLLQQISKIETMEENLGHQIEQQAAFSRYQAECTVSPQEMEAFFGILGGELQAVLNKVAILRQEDGTQVAGGFHSVEQVESFAHTRVFGRELRSPEFREDVTLLLSLLKQDVVEDIERRTSAPGEAGVLEKRLCLRVHLPDIAPGVDVAAVLTDIEGKEDFLFLSREELAQNFFHAPLPKDKSYAFVRVSDLSRDFFNLPFQEIGFSHEAPLSLRKVVIVEKPKAWSEMKAHFCHPRDFGFFDRHLPVGSKMWNMSGLEHAPILGFDPLKIENLYYSFVPEEMDDLSTRVIFSNGESVGTRAFQQSPSQPSKGFFLYESPMDLQAELGRRKTVQELIAACARLVFEWPLIQQANERERQALNERVEQQYSIDILEEQDGRLKYFHPDGGIAYSALMRDIAAKGSASRTPEDHCFYQRYLSYLRELSQQDQLQALQRRQEVLERRQQERMLQWIQEQRASSAARLAEQQQMEQGREEEQRMALQRERDRQEARSMGLVEELTLEETRAENASRYRQLVKAYDAASSSQEREAILKRQYEQDLADQALGSAPRFTQADGSVDFEKLTGAIQCRMDQTQQLPETHGFHQAYFDYVETQRQQVNAKMWPRIRRLEVEFPEHARYYKDVRFVLNGIVGGIPGGEATFSYTPMVLEIFQKIAQSPEITAAKKHSMIPHPVQVLSVLRLVEEILTPAGKGAIGQIKTGEGKSFIIAVAAITLVKHGRLVDIVTSTSQLAKRDQQGQKMYYDLFGIGSGVLLSHSSDQPLLSEREKKSGDEFTYHALDCPIVYGTNCNFEFVYLHSLFRKNPPRKRPYDVVIVDEVDNMFLDQSSSPAIISRSFKIADYRLIFKLVYENRKQSVDEVIDILEDELPEYPEWSRSTIQLLLRAAKISDRYENQVDYIVSKKKEGGKEKLAIIIMDRSTMCAKEGSRWSNFIHEMVEIKHGLEIEYPSISSCAVTQELFFNLYRKITGVTGTLGSPSERAQLHQLFGVKTFEIPENVPSQRIPNRTAKKFTRGDLVQEIRTACQANRPILVIFSDPKALKAMGDVAHHHEILGVNPDDDEKVVEKAGLPGTVTFATVVAGRGMDIQPNNTAVRAGGLHVVITTPPSNSRSLEQAIGRAGRQGKPGSYMIYNCKQGFEAPRDSAPRYKLLFELQQKFAHAFKTTWKWVFEGGERGGEAKVLFPIKPDYQYVMKHYAWMVYRDFFEKSATKEKLDDDFIVYAPLIRIGDFHAKERADEDYRAKEVSATSRMTLTKDQEKKFTAYLRQMIEISWGRFFTNLSETDEDGLCEGDNPEFVEHHYQEFIAELGKYIPVGESPLNVYRNILELTAGSTDERPPFLDYVESAGRFRSQLIMAVSGIFEGVCGAGKFGVGAGLLLTALEASNPIGWAIAGATIAAYGLNAMSRGSDRIKNACVGDLHSQATGSIEAVLPDKCKGLFTAGDIATDFVTPFAASRLSALSGGSRLAKYSMVPPLRGTVPAGVFGKLEGGVNVVLGQQRAEQVAAAIWKVRAKMISLGTLQGERGAGRLVLGKFDNGAITSYVKEASRRGAQYFQLSQDQWALLKYRYGEDAIWEINKAFLDRQIRSGKEILLSHNPDDFIGGISFYSREIEHLISNGFKIEPFENIWRAIRR